MRPGNDVTVYAATRHELGEGARWVRGRLVWVDLLDGSLWERDPDSAAPRRILRVGAPLGAVAPTADGRWLAACGTGIALLDADRSTWLHRPEDGAATPMRMNDAAVDPAGRFLAGSMAYDNTRHAGRLYRLAADGSLTCLIDGVTVPNGPVFSPSGDRMYLADSAAGLIDAYDYQPVSGELGGRRTFVRLEPGTGSPDGMAVDAEGHVWSAVWGAGRVDRYDPEGALVESRPVPARQPTSCAFGPDGSGRLFLTTARYGLTEPTDVDGAVLALPAPAGGVPLPTATVPESLTR